PVVQPVTKTQPAPTHIIPPQVNTGFRRKSAPRSTRLDTHAGPWHFGPRGGAVHDRRTREHRSGDARAAGAGASPGFRIEAGDRARSEVLPPEATPARPHPDDA